MKALWLILARVADRDGKDSVEITIRKKDFFQGTCLSKNYF
jgi:hypothetical protein